MRREVKVCSSVLVLFSGAPAAPRVRVRVHEGDGGTERMRVLAQEKEQKQGENMEQM